MQCVFFGASLASDVVEDYDDGGSAAAAAAAAAGGASANLGTGMGGGFETSASSSADSSNAGKGKRAKSLGALDASGAFLGGEVVDLNLHATLPLVAALSAKRLVIWDYCSREIVLSESLSDLEKCAKASSQNSSFRAICFHDGDASIAATAEGLDFGFNGGVVGDRRSKSRWLVCAGERSSLLVQYAHSDESAAALPGISRSSLEATTIPCGSSTILSLSERTVVLGGDTGAIHIWDTKSMREVMTLKRVHASPVTSLCMVDRGERGLERYVRFVSGCKGGKVAVWELKIASSSSSSSEFDQDQPPYFGLVYASKTGFAHPKSAVESVDYDFSTGTLTTAGSDRKTRIWELHVHPGRGAAFRPHNSSAEATAESSRGRNFPSAAKLLHDLGRIPDAGKSDKAVCSWSGHPAWPRHSVVAATKGGTLIVLLPNALALEAVHSLLPGVSFESARRRSISKATDASSESSGSTLHSSVAGKRGAGLCVQVSEIFDAEVFAASRLPLLKKSRASKLRISKIRSHPLQPHLLAVGTKLGVIVLSYDATRVPPCAPVPRRWVSSDVPCKIAYFYEDGALMERHFSHATSGMLAKPCSPARILNEQCMCRVSPWSLPLELNGKVHANTTFRLKYTCDASASTPDYPAWCDAPSIHTKFIASSQQPLKLVALVWKRICRYIVVRIVDVVAADGSRAGQKGVVVDCGEGSCALWSADAKAARLVVASSGHALREAGGEFSEAAAAQASSSSGRKRRSTSVFTMGRKSSTARPSSLSVFDHFDDPAAAGRDHAGSIGDGVDGFVSDINPDALSGIAGAGFDPHLGDAPKLTFYDYEVADDPKEVRIASRVVNLMCAPVSLMGSGPLLMVAYGPEFDTRVAFGDDDVAASAWNSSVGAGRSLAGKAQFYEWSLQALHGSSDAFSMKKVGPAWDAVPSFVQWDCELTGGGSARAEASTVRHCAVVVNGCDRTDHRVAAPRSSCAKLFIISMEHHVFLEEDKKASRAARRKSRVSGKSDEKPVMRQKHRVSTRVEDTITLNESGAVTSVLWFHGSLFVSAISGIWLVPVGTNFLGTDMRNRSYGYMRQTKPIPVASEDLGGKGLPRGRFALAAISGGDLIAYQAFGGPQCRGEAGLKRVPLTSAMVRFTMLVCAGLVERALPWVLKIRKRYHDQCAVFLQRHGYVAASLDRSYLPGLSLALEFAICVHNKFVVGAVAMLEKGLSEDGGEFLNKLLDTDAAGAPYARTSAGSLRTLEKPSPWGASAQTKHEWRTDATFNLMKAKDSENALRRLAALLALHLGDTFRESKSADRGIRMLYDACYKYGRYDDALFVAGVHPGMRREYMFNASLARAKRIETTWEQETKGMSLEVKDMAKDFAAKDVAEFGIIAMGKSGKDCDDVKWMKGLWTHVTGFDIEKAPAEDCYSKNGLEEDGSDLVTPVKRTIPE